MSGHRELQVHESLNVQSVEMEDALSEIEQTERSDNSDDSQHRGDCQHEPHVPGFGLVLVLDVVVGDRKDGSVVEQRDHDNHDGGHRVEIEDQDRQGHEEQDAQRLRDAVDGVAVHPLKYAATLFDGVDDHRQP